MAKAKRSAKKQRRPESLHHLISSLTYRASIGRSLLFAIVLAPFFIFTYTSLQGITDPGHAAGLSIIPLLAVIAVFFIYDLLYVSLAYYYPINKLADKLVLFIVELGILALLLLPLVWLELSADVTKTSTVALLATTPVFILLVRVLVGVRASQVKARRK